MAILNKKHNTTYCYLYLFSLIRKGKGVSLGEIKQVGGGGFTAQPSQTLYKTDVTHSAGVDHKYNAKPKAFGASSSSPSGAQTVSAKKFDPAEYARRKYVLIKKFFKI